MEAMSTTGSGAPLATRPTNGNGQAAQPADSAAVTRRYVLTELALCTAQPAHFVHRYCQIYDATLGGWRPFDLWPAQQETLRVFHESQLTIALKARQVGMTWLALAYSLWTMLFRPAATVLLFSRRDTEAIFLLGNRDNRDGDSRLRGMFDHLPSWMKTGLTTTSDSAHEWALSNGSVAKAFPTTAGDSYTATLAVVDEADLAPDLNRLLRAVKPTIDAGNRMLLVSRANKDEPNSEFKRLYRAAKRGAGPWQAVFLPWSARPDRTMAWYIEQQQEIMDRTHSLDDLYEQYPATDTEALAARSQDKRIAGKLLEACYNEADALADVTDDPFVPGLLIFEEPQPDEQYVIGADPAEGNPQSDESAACVLHRLSGRQVAVLAGRFEPATFAAYIKQTSEYYNGAQVLVERNNHGHAVIMWLEANASMVIQAGRDDKPGWQTTALSKALLYERVVEALKNAELVIHDAETYLQLQSVEGSTLKAPGNMHDDRAMALCLANVAKTTQGVGIYI